MSEMQLQRHITAGDIAARQRGRRLPFMYTLLQQVCEYPSLPIAAVLCSAALQAPALATGFLADDYVHQLILTKSTQLSAYHQPWTRLFQFGTPSVNPALFADGVLAWWADPQLKYSFFRPLSALTHLFDYSLWPQSSVLMHAHSLLWAAFTALAVGYLYRQLFEQRWMANLGISLYALDPTRAISVTWIANRNALIACTFGALSIATFLRGVRGSKRASWASPCLFAAAVASGEAGFAAAAYLLAAALCLDQGALRRRLWKLAPHVLLGLGLLIISRRLGFGVASSGVYFDPVHDMRSYLAALPGRVLALQAAAFGGPSADAGAGYDLVAPGLATLIVVLELCALGFWTLLLGPLVRRSASARFAALGSALALLPAAAAAPSDRLLGYTAIGVMALLVEAFARLIDSGHSRPRRLELAVGSIVMLRLILSPALLVAQTTNMNRVRYVLDRTNQAVPWNQAVKNEHVVLMNPPQDPLVSFIPALRAASGVPRPASLRWLATGLTALAVRRTGERTLELTQEQGFLKQHTERLVRSAGHPLRVADKVHLPELSVEILEVTADQRPLRVSVELARPLSEPNMRWLAFRETKYEAFVLPAVGECVVLPANDFLAMVIGSDSVLVRWLKAYRSRFGQPTPDLCRPPL